MVCKFFDKKLKGGGVNITLEFNEQLPEELHKPIIRNPKKRTVYSRFKDNIWGVDLADMQLISKFNNRFWLLLCVIDIFSKYANFSKFYNNSFKKWLKENDIEMCWINNEKKSVFAERFIRISKTKIYKYMTTLVSKNVYIDKFDNIVGEYNNTYYRTIKIKPADVKDNTYIDFKKIILNLKLAIM